MLSLMLLSVDTQSSAGSSTEAVEGQSIVAPTKVQELVQLLPAERHVSVAAELDASQLQDVEDLLSDLPQGSRLGQQVVQRPKAGGDGVGHRCPQHGKMMG